MRAIHSLGLSLFACGVGAALLFTAADHPSSTVRSASSPPASFDDPDEAARFQDAKRRDPLGRVVAADAYRAAISTPGAHGSVLVPHGTGARARRGNHGLGDPRRAGCHRGRARHMDAARPRQHRRPLACPAASTRSSLRVMFAAGVSGGVWRTDDGGANWRPLGESMANLAINAMAMDPANPDVLYAGTGEGYFREEVRGTGLPLRGGGIFKTADGGATWTRLPAHRRRRLPLGQRPRRQLARHAGGSTPRRARASGSRWMRARRGRACSTPRFAAAASTWRSVATAPTTCCLRRAGRSSRRRCTACSTPRGVVRSRSRCASPGWGARRWPSPRRIPTWSTRMAAGNERGAVRQWRAGALRACSGPTAGGAPGTWAPRVTRDDPLKLAPPAADEPHLGDGRGVPDGRAQLDHEHGLVRERHRGRSSQSRTSSGPAGWTGSGPTTAGSPGDWCRTGGPRRRCLPSPTPTSTPSRSTRRTTARATRRWSSPATAGSTGATTRGRGRRRARWGRAIRAVRGRVDAAESRLRRDAVLPRCPVSRRPARHRRDAGQRHDPLGRGAGFDGWRRVLGGDGGYVAVDPATPTSSTPRRSGATCGSRRTVARRSPPRSAAWRRPSATHSVPTATTCSSPRSRWTRTTAGRSGSAGRRSTARVTGRRTGRRRARRLEDGGKVSAVAIAPTDGNRVAVGCVERLGLSCTRALASRRARPRGRARSPATAG